jgi:hypothetical protein
LWADALEPPGLLYYPATPVKIVKFFPKKEQPCEACPPAPKGDNFELEPGGNTIAGPGIVKDLAIDAIKPVYDARDLATRRNIVATLDCFVGNA